MYIELNIIKFLHIQSIRNLRKQFIFEKITRDITEVTGSGNVKLHVSGVSDFKTTLKGITHNSIQLNVCALVSQYSLDSINNILGLWCGSVLAGLCVGHRSVHATDSYDGSV